LPIVLGAKSTILDIKAKDQRGNEYIVEMQVTDKIGFAKRAVFYAAKSYSFQLQSGENYYNLKPTIFIGILNFTFLETTNYLSRHLILDVETQEHQLKDLNFNFIELPKFNKTEPELSSLVEKWIFFIKNAKDLNVIPASVDDAGLKSAYIEADRHTWTKADLAAYDYARMRETDEITREMFVIKKRNFEIARNAIIRGADNEFIAAITGLTVEEIQTLRQEKK
jgi:predicted transposase/invertase (TIGR01784 family)